MTRDEVMAMEPGRELDALVAEKVMGLEVLPSHRVLVSEKGPFPECECPSHAWTIPLPEYSTDIKAAWKVVEHVNRITKLRFGLATLDNGKIWAGFGSHADGTKVYEHQAVTAPEAICKAALLAVMEGLG